MENQKKKILYIVTESNWGGAQRYVYDLATNLPKEKFEAKVALGGDGELKKRLEEAGISVINIPKLYRDIKPASEISVFVSLCKIIYREKPNIVHLNSSKIGGLGSLASSVINLFYSFLSVFNAKTKNYKLKTVFTAHGWAFKERRIWFWRQATVLLSCLTVFMCQKTIVVSDDDLEKISGLPVSRKKIIKVLNGIGKIDFLTKQEARREIARLEDTTLEESFWIGTVAELHKNKGLIYVVEAAANLLANEKISETIGKKIIFAVIGEGEERENLQKLIVEQKLNQNFFLFGQRPNAASLLKAFDVFVLPSLKEGLPYSLLEAGAASLPIVATDVGGVSEIIQDMKSGIVVKAKRGREPSSALEFIIEHKKEARAFGAEIKEKIRKDFSPDRMLKETITVYEDIG